MPTIIGIDLSKSSISCCVISERPLDIRSFYFDCQFHRFFANASGISALLALVPTGVHVIAVMEPTGVNYQKIWGTHLARSGIEVRLVGHKQLRNFREGFLELPDKDDDADALALAIYGWDYLNTPAKFLQVRDSTIVEIRRLVLRLAHLNRVQSPIINRLRQDLAWQFPEIALVRSKRGSGTMPLLWGWLADYRKSAKYDTAYSKSVGLGLDSDSKLHAARLCNLQSEENLIELSLSGFIEKPEFLRYRKVFKKFGFGQRVEALLLSQIYPFESFLVNGKPEVRIRKGRNSGKPTKRHLSLRRFCKALGEAPSRESSGDVSKSKVVGGSALCRKALWQWVFTRLEVKRCRLTNEIGLILGEFLDADKASGRPIKLVRVRVAAKAAKLLFREFVAEFCHASDDDVLD